MPTARHHYMVDFYFSNGASESRRITAYDDHEAIKESGIASIGARPFGVLPASSIKLSHYRVRKVTHANDRQGGDVIHDSRKVPHA